MFVCLLACVFAGRDEGGIYRKGMGSSTLLVSLVDGSCMVEEDGEVSGKEKSRPEN